MFKKMFLTSAIALCCLGSCSIAAAENQSYDAKLLLGNYAKAKLVDNGKAGANMFGHASGAYCVGEVFFVLQHKKDDGFDTISYIGSINSAQGGGTFFHVDRMIKRSFNDGKPSVVKINRDYPMLFKVITKDGKQFTLRNEYLKEKADLDITGKYVWMNGAPELSEDMAIYLLESYANDKNTIHYAPRKKQYKYSTRYISTNNDDDIEFQKLKKWMAKEGRSFDGAAVIDCVAADGSYGGAYYVSYDGRNIMQEIGGTFRFIWTADAVS